MRRVSGGGETVRVGLLAGLVLASLVVGTAGLAAGQTGPAGPAFAQSEIDPDAVVMRVETERGGDARWAVDFRLRLDDDNATDAFESVAADVERNASAFTADFATGMRRTVRSAENRTGREMALRNVTVSTRRETLPQEYGVVTYRFEWTGFAAVDGERIRAGDALSGLFLDGESSLVFAWPEGYAAASVSPEPDERGNNSVTWHGPTEFGPNAPRLVAEPADRDGNGGGADGNGDSDGGDGNGNGNGGADGAGDGDGSSGGVNASLLAAAVIVLAVAAAAGWAVVTRTDLLGGAPTAGGAGPDTGVGASGGSDTAGAGGAGGAAAAGGDPPEELLSNEEKVLRLLDEEGGRVKQQRIAGEFDWTDAKTSQVVGKLRDQDEVETFRIGRENVVALPEKSDI